MQKNKSKRVFVTKDVYNDTIKKYKLAENELIELSEKTKAISTKGLTKDLINKLSIMDQNIFFRNISKSFSIYTS